MADCEHPEGLTEYLAGHPDTERLGTCARCRAVLTDLEALGWLVRQTKAMKKVDPSYAVGAWGFPAPEV